MRLILTCAVAAGLAATVAPGGETASPPAVSGQLILDEGSRWRMSALWSTPMVRKGADVTPYNARENAGFRTGTAPVPADWIQPDFTDGSWTRWSQSRNWAKEDPYGFYGPGPTLGLLCLRGKFAVEDPARVQKLTLSLAYRGGVVVYVNGQEAARAHLPKDGKIEPETLADDYPEETFVHKDGVFRGSNCLFSEHGYGPKGPAAYTAQLEKRNRRLENVTIDAKLLRKGTNVLAVEIHRAPYFGTGLEMESMNHRSVWNTCGLLSLAMRAEGGVTPNIARPAGIQVWVASSMHRPHPMDYGNPLEKNEPVVIVGCQNGVFDGKVMVSSDQALAGVKAQAGDLKHKDGKSVIPAAAVKLLYTIRDDRMTQCSGVPSGGFWDTLAEEPPAKVEPVAGMGVCQAVVLKVRVPADATPGDYSGKLTVSGEGLAATEVPVELKVIGWKLPDTKDFATHMGVIQSPDSLAMWYKVPLWSEEHWKYLEESFKLLGELGNNEVVIPIVTRTNLGHEQSMIRWIKDGDGYKYDFTIFDRYLDLARKYQKLDVVCLYAYEQYVLKGTVGLKVTLWDPGTGKSQDLEGPLFNKPEEFRKFWGPVYKEIAARLAQRGLTDALMMGITADWGGGYHLTKEMGALYKELMPGVKWVSNAHSDFRGGNEGGVPIGYNTFYYLNICEPPGTTPANYPGSLNGRYYGWRTKTDYYARQRGPLTLLTSWRASVDAALVHNAAGKGRTGADFWPVLQPAEWKLNRGGGEKGSNSVGARYPESDWCQLNLDRGNEAILGAGPRGALPTENFEQIRQGIQECQVRILMEKAILAKQLDPDLAKRCQDLLDLRTMHIRGLGSCGGGGSGELGSWTLNAWYEGTGAAGLTEKLYTLAAEVVAKTGAR